MHNPNPFDFVPFAEKPLLRTPEEYDALGDPLSGYLELRLKALTPVHIVGYQTSNGEEGQSYLYRENGEACIPAATIRGCLRAFVEALTSGWVSQANPEYPKEYCKRHIGFRAFEEYQPNGTQSHRRTSPAAINEDYKPGLRPDRKIDAASYLFGMVLEPPESQNLEHSELARKSRIFVEDAFLAPNSIEIGKDRIPDVAGDSFMGGGKPSASTWWYMKPEQYWIRTIKTPAGRKKVAEFIGGKFWGRKFYFHQEPEACVQYYENSWKFASDRPLYTVHLECQKRNEQTEKFRIYLDRIPSALVRLLVLALNPGKNIRHKLGYGKSYGYGSVEFRIEGAQFRPSPSSSRIPASLVDYVASREIEKWTALAWNREELMKKGLDNSILDYQALDSLARILGWQDNEKVLFTYPPYDKNNFKQPVSEDQLNQALTMLDKNKSAGDVAKGLFNIKKTIHFRYYQEHADGWNIISARKP